MLTYELWEADKANEDGSFDNPHYLQDVLSDEILTESGSWSTSKGKVRWYRTPAPLFNLVNGEWTEIKYK